MKLQRNPVCLLRWKNGTSLPGCSLTSAGLSILTQMNSCTDKAVRERKEGRQADRQTKTPDHRVLLARIIRTFKSMRVQSSFRSKYFMKIPEVATHVSLSSSSMSGWRDDCYTC